MVWKSVQDREASCEEFGEVAQGEMTVSVSERIIDADSKIVLMTIPSGILSLMSAITILSTLAGLIIYEDLMKVKDNRSLPRTRYSFTLYVQYVPVDELTHHGIDFFSRS